MNFLQTLVEQSGYSLSDEAYKLLEAAFQTFSSQLSDDLVAFAKHAKRKTINVQDVVLFCRRNPQLVEQLLRLTKAEDSQS
ncbi:hypothetical protein P9112_008721 [Eukaryota sp. TZLM1-RC]